MTQTNYLEILKAIRTCVQKPYYKVGVFSITSKDADHNYRDVIAAIRMDSEENDAVQSYRNTFTDKSVIFKNKSCIRFVRASENARGYKFNRVLYDANIDRKILDTVVRMTKFRYMEAPNER